MRNTARCDTGHDQPESAVTIAGIRNATRKVTAAPCGHQDARKQRGATGQPKPIPVGIKCWMVQKNGHRWSLTKHGRSPKNMVTL
jgi:hypothetical protein